MEAVKNIETEVNSQKDENINLLDYGYTKDSAPTELPSEAIYQLMLFAKAVSESEKRFGFSHFYPKNKPKTHKDKEGNVEAVEIEWETYPTATSFFNQNPQVFHTELGAAALDLENKMKSIHLDNIKLGKAVKLGEFKQQTTNEAEETAVFS